MRLSEAVPIYVSERRDEGAQFHTGEAILKRLLKRLGDVELRDISAHALAAYFAEGALTPATIRSKSSAIRCFLKFWSRRGEVLMPVFPEVARRAARIPRIYSREEVRALLKAAPACQKRNSVLDAPTLRMMLLTMYAVGASCDEVLAIDRSSVDIRRRRITLSASEWRGTRTLPLGSGYAAELAVYLSSRPRRKGGERLFSKTSGQPVSRDYFNQRFRRLRELAGLKNRPNGCPPRLHDLRNTFAVHRLTTWIKEKQNLNELLPALSTYMGYASLVKAEQFLAFAPERFREDLLKLSPGKGRKHWRDDPELLAKMAAL